MIKIKKADLTSYPYLAEEGPLCDHELLTDGLSSLLAVTSTTASAVCPDIVPLLNSMVLNVYHMNGSIRGKNAITETEVEDIYLKYMEYKAKIAGAVTGFVLPGGSLLSSWLHVARCDAKKVVRNMHKIKRAGFEVGETLFDYMNIASNLLFVLAVYTNKVQGITETEFVSKSY